MRRRIGSAATWTLALGGLGSFFAACPSPHSTSATARAAAVVGPFAEAADHQSTEGGILAGVTTASRPAVRAAVPRRSLLVVATGDVLTESRVLDAGSAAAEPGERYDFSALFAPIVPIIAGADLAICHMELPIGGRGARPGVYGRSPHGGNLLLAPYEVAGAVKAAGFDRCSTASNHSNDLGIDGIASTLAALDEAGLGHSGTARSDSEAIVTVFRVNGVAVAHLSYTTFANSPPLPEPWMNFGGSVAEVAKAARDARAAGAEIVILSLHIAKEMLSTPTSYDRQFVVDLTAAVPIDLVVEHGPHVIQPVEIVNGAVVYWSVGNLLTAMGVPGTGRYEDQRTLDGLIAGVRFTEVAAGDFAAEVWPVLVCNERSSRVIYAPLVALADASTSPQLRGQLEACVTRSIGIVPDLH